MSSREIAELTGKRHDNVMADIRNMLHELGRTSPEFSGNLPDSYGRPQAVFFLPKDLYAKGLLPLTKVGQEKRAMASAA